MTIWILVAMMLLMLLILTVVETQMKKMQQMYEKKIDSLEDCLAKLSEVVAERSEPEIEPIEKKIQEAKWDVFSDWIDNIVNYDPRGQR